jgi:uncharacterized protein YneF (UPF0154 family)
MNNTFTQTLSAIVIGGLILGGIGAVSYPYIKKEYAIKQFAEKYNLTTKQARMWTNDGKNLEEPRVFQLLRQARGQ